MLYEIILVLTRIVLNLFFRTVKIRGFQNIPKDGPIIFAVAPHANQFIDPLIVMNHCQRTVSYLIARKSYDRPFIGFFAKAFGAIPVVRPQDLTNVGKGLVYFDSDLKNIIKGVDTNFSLKLSPRSIISITGMTVEIISIESDTQATIKTPITIDQTIPTTKETAVGYKITPYVNQGGSHDRTEFLPLKPGFAIMALGAMDKYPGLDVKIVPCGLNYFNRDKVRSRVVLEFGEPISITPEILKQYQSGGQEKRTAISTVLEQTHKKLKCVTVTAPDIDTLSFLQLVRRLYKPAHVKLGLDQTLELTRRFAAGYEKFKDEKRFKDLFVEVRNYDRLLMAFGIKDFQVKNIAIADISWAYRNLVIRILKFLVIFMFAFPGILLHFPIVFIVSKMALEKAKEAKNESKVKIEGKDVIGSWKIMIGIPVTFLFYTVYSLIFLIYIFVKGYTSIFTKTSVFFSFVLPFLGCITIKAYEINVDLISSLTPLIIALFRSKKSHETLRIMRADLSTKIIQMVNDYGPKIFDLTPEEFEKWKLVQTYQSDFGKKLTEEIKQGKVKKQGMFEFDLDWDEIDLKDLNTIDDVFLFQDDSGGAIDGDQNKFRKRNLGSSLKTL